MSREAVEGSESSKSIEKCSESTRTVPIADVFVPDEIYPDPDPYPADGSLSVLRIQIRPDMVTNTTVCVHANDGLRPPQVPQAVIFLFWLYLQ